METAAAERQGDLEHLWAEQAPRLWRAVLGYTGDPDLARDCVSEAFAEAIRQWDGIRAPEAWLWKVSFSVAKRELTRRSHLAPERASSYIMDERALQVTLALAKLTGRQRAVVVLHYYAGNTTAEIGKILGMSASTAAVHLFRGRRRLREILGEEGEDDA